MEDTLTPIRRQPRERNSILKKYYGIKDKVVDSSSQSQDNARPFDIDGNSFNSSKYFASLLKEKSLKELVEKNNQLVGEIREIDGDMKTLVYENYSKFISATDTIRKMKSNVESMESEMARLNENIAQISNQSKTINQELGPNRQKIQQLSNVHNSLKRLQFVFDLPNRLQHCLNKGKYSQAVKYYSKASRLLNHYQHMAAFKGIERDCMQIMEKVKAEIWINLTDPNATPQNVAEETKLLVLLGEDTQKLRKKYIDIQLATFSKKQDEHSQLTTIPELISAYIVPLEDIVHHFENLFLTEDESNVDMEYENKDQAKEDLLSAINPYLDKFFGLLAEFIELPLHISLDKPLEQSVYLSELKSTVGNTTPSLTTVARLDSRIDSLIAQWENNLISGIFDSSLAGLRDRTSTFAKTLQKSSLSENYSCEFNANAITEFIQTTQVWLVDYLSKSCLLPLKGCLDINNKQTLNRIQSGIKSVWKKLADQFENIKALLKLDKSSLQILELVASRLCYDLADSGIFQIYDDSVDPQVIPDLNNSIECLLKIGQKLLNSHMMQEGYYLSARIQEAYLESTFTKPVHQVSEVWYLAYNRLKYTERLAEVVYPQYQPQARGSVDTSIEPEFDYNGPYSSHHVLQSTNSLATASSISETPTKQQFSPNDISFNMMNNIDKLFAERVDIYKKVEPNPIGICVGLVLIILKAFLEVTREAHMNTNAYQQIQVDIEFVKRVVWPYAGDEKWATTMLQEVLSSTYTRCASPKSISQDEIALILSPQ
ncbi:Vps51/Vps67-domain-containing protein [Gilbertella persicaria]|uniref:Vps51/Vps67-domain-containing protein n=1 Tax=Gilbertella persicaria TaxID=101096 RepID=UPI00221FAD48|nr:Vps51/Vps67-domain-containing protein [Gilbertella persicaria]KAI8087890.1 Vps51/Vps67-domain-containing protein [Gilbertella persicaria]